MRLTALAASVALTLSATAAGAQDLTAGDAAAGERIFLKCGACHAVGEGAAHKLGPHLNDVFGRVPGGMPDYDYSAAMVAFGEGKVWTPELMADYLRAPRQVVDGTKMAFLGLRKEEDQADIIAYLAQFDPDGTEVEAAATN